MREFANIFGEYKKLDLNKCRYALATVVQVKGSSYRSPGARMLITDQGRWFGSISGGCLEGDALRKARQVMQSGKPMTVTYDTNEGSDQNLGINLGCNGIIDVLLEPITNTQDPLALFHELSEEQVIFAVATIFNSNTSNGEKLVIRSDGKVLNTFTDDALTRKVLPELESVFNTRKSHTRSYQLGSEQIEVFIELGQPKISLIIFGAGVDARPVSALAKTFGWEVDVSHECVAHIAPAFFPNADKLSLCHREYIDKEIIITPSTACVLMSHNYEYDRAVLAKLLTTATPYIGIMGPRKRLDRMFTELELLGVQLTANDYERIHAPIGLDIAAETPEELAVSIIGEIQAKFHSRDGGFLKSRRHTIHDRDPLSAQVLKTVHI